MSALSTIIRGAAAIASLAYPPAAPFLAFISTVEPYAEAAVPMIQAAIKEGPAAFSAAKANAPEFMGALTTFAGRLKAVLGSSEPPTDDEVAAIAAHVVGIDPPGWTHDETVRWWERTGNPGQF